MSTHTPSVTPGQTLANPVTGERFTFTHTAASTNGELLAFELALRPAEGRARLQTLRAEARQAGYGVMVRGASRLLDPEGVEEDVDGEAGDGGAAGVPDAGM